ncbi:MAG: ribosomal protein S18-alanine N-acetyltransferase [Alphaproteobacteria bacterium]|jgi:ribosomal-protein-alanine N-acetyltransferase|nr:ribosomal protein S18-alanine N-acetyltransferase [Alphaproteobacteria bacterium]
MRDPLPLQRGPIVLWPAGPAEAAGLAALQALCVGERPGLEAWPAAEWQALLTQSGTVALLAGLPGEEPAGFALVRATWDESELYSIGVRPDRRRLGLGLALLQAACRSLADSGARVLFLEVACSNAEALALYSGAGFELVGRRRDYYRSSAGTEDALVMARSLTAADLRTGQLETE